MLDDGTRLDGLEKEDGDEKADDDETHVDTDKGDHQRVFWVGLTG